MQRSITTSGTGRRTLIGVAALAASTALLLTGCGRSDGPDESGPVDTVDDSAATGELDVWAMGAEGENLPELAAAFEEANPDVTVNVTAVPWTNAHDKLATAIAAGQTPDMSMIGTTWMAEFTAADGFREVPDGLVDSASFFPGSWETAEVDGAAYAVPWYADTRVLFYRADLAEQAGVEPPTTWEEYEQFAAALQEEGAEYGTYLQSGGEGTTNLFAPFLWQAGGDFMTEDETEFTLDTPEMVDALTFYSGLFEDGYSPTESLLNVYQSQFADGTLGSYVSGPYELVALRDLLGDEFDDVVGVATLPENEQPASFSGGSNLAVFQTADNPDAAWKFIEWLSQPDVQQQWYEIQTDLPAVAEAWETGALADDERLATIGEQLDSSRPTPNITTWAEIDKMMNESIEQVVRGVLTPEEGAAQMQERAEQIGTGAEA